MAYTVFTLDARSEMSEHSNAPSAESYPYTSMVRTSAAFITADATSVPMSFLTLPIMPLLNNTPSGTDPNGGVVTACYLII